MTPTDTHYDLMADTRRKHDDEGVEEYCEFCGLPLDQCDCFDEDEEGPEAA